MHEGSSEPSKDCNARSEALQNDPGASKEQRGLSWLQVLGAFCLNLNSW